MTPTVIQRLREAKGRILLPSAVNVLVAAVERELAAKDAEIAELRKRPTLDEIREMCGLAWPDMSHGIEALYLRRSVGPAAKARAEAPK